MKNTKKYGSFAATVENIQICAARLEQLHQISLFALTDEDYRQQCAFTDALERFADNLKEQAQNARKYNEETIELAKREQEKQALFIACRDLGCVEYSEMVRKITDDTIKAAHDLGITERDELVQYLIFGIEPEPDRVAFRVFVDELDERDESERQFEVIALFPDLICDHDGNITSYMHVGQHGPAGRELLNTLRPATPDEYADLAKELTNYCGYRLDIYEESNDHHDFYVYAGYYENYISTVPMDAPRVFQRVFDNIEDAMDYCDDRGDCTIFCDNVSGYLPTWMEESEIDFFHFEPTAQLLAA